MVLSEECESISSRNPPITVPGCLVSVDAQTRLSGYCVHSLTLVLLLA